MAHVKIVNARGQERTVKVIRKGLKSKLRVSKPTEPIQIPEPTPVTTAHQKEVVTPINTSLDMFEDFMTAQLEIFNNKQHRRRRKHKGNDHDWY